MAPTLMVCLILSFALAIVSLMVLQLRRQRRGLQALLHQLLRKDPLHAESNAAGESVPIHDGGSRLDPDHHRP
ncbi:hypothetical protein [Novipirellula artificiosorum]|uniref:hypothetical protein n=1 Tax=Novipirellula artificiosorum TaxID=2528016 RepID=UPI0011B45837|nr:hypothetical protein [Novipirellula artificiosorum]